MQELTAGPRGPPSGTSRYEAFVHAVLAPGMPLEWLGSRSHEVRSVRQQGPAWAAARDGSHGVAAARAAVRAPQPPADLHVVDTVAQRVPMDRDFVIAWRPQVGVAPAVTALTETVGDTTYALLLILPPDAAHVGGSQPREQIFVIDSSGSMGGQSIVQAQAALKDALGRLGSGDRFNVIDFDSGATSLYPAPQSFTRESYAAALRFVERLVADGGTNIEIGRAHV